MKPGAQAATWWLMAASGGMQAGHLVRGQAQAQAAQAVTELDAVVVTLQQSQAQGASRRQQAEKEKARLRGTLDRRKGPWSAQHPRHRLLDALCGFAQYAERQTAELARLRGLLGHVSSAQKALLERLVSYSARFDRVQQKLVANQALCDAIVRAALDFYGLGPDELRRHGQAVEATADNSTSVSQALKHIVRDWTHEGQQARSSAFACILHSLAQLFPLRHAMAEPVKVLLPGAGLARLGHDIDRLGGFDVTVNEWSMYMNVVYRFLEAHGLKHGRQFHPFVDNWSHHATDADMHRALRFPDTDMDAQSVLMVEGDFTTVFQHHPGYYHVVVTYFFIDTARNLMSYFDTIKHLVKEGGYWINLGPLLYGTSPCVQLSLEDIINVTEAMGFHYLDTDEACGPLTFPDRTVRSLEAVYSFDKAALTKNAYEAQFWVAQRL